MYSKVVSIRYMCCKVVVAVSWESGREGPDGKARRPSEV